MIKPFSSVVLTTSMSFLSSCDWWGIWFVWLFVPGLAVGLDPEGYGNPDFCWISIYDKLIWSFAGPIAIVILVTSADLLCTDTLMCINHDLNWKIWGGFLGGAMIINANMCSDKKWSDTSEGMKFRTVKSV